MSKISDRKLAKFLEKNALEDFFVEFKKINSQGQFNDFLNKFLTDSEIAILIRRLVIIDLLKKNTKYRDIKKKLRVSGNTISGVRDILSGRNYRHNPNRKRKYSESSLLPAKPRKKFRRIRRYKGAIGIFDLFPDLE